MSQLSSYIHHELHSLMKQIQKTPPRKQSSLAKIEALVRTAPIDQHEKQKIRDEIRQVQSFIISTCTPQKSTRTSSRPTKRSSKTQRLFQMSEDPLLVKNILKSKINKQQNSSKKIAVLQQKYEELKAIRKSKQEYLQKLIIKVQRLERVKHSRAKSAQKNKQKEARTRQYNQKQQKLQKLKEETLLAAKQHRKEMVQKLMSKYNDNIKV